MHLIGSASGSIYISGCQSQIKGSFSKRCSPAPNLALSWKRFSSCMLLFRLHFSGQTEKMTTATREKKQGASPVACRPVGRLHRTPPRRWSPRSPRCWAARMRRCHSPPRTPPAAAAAPRGAPCSARGSPPVHISHISHARITAVSHLSVTATIQRPAAPGGSALLGPWIVATAR